MPNPMNDDADTSFARIRTTLVMPGLVGTAPINLGPRVLHFFSAPFLVSLVFSLTSEFIPKHWQSIVVAAVSGQLAVTLMKLFLYIAILLLGVATAAKHISCFRVIVACPFRWAGTQLAEVAFDYTSGAVGVIAGIAPAIIYEHHLQGFFQVCYIVIIMMLGQFSMWCLTNLAASNFDRHVPKPVFIWLGGLAFACIAIYSLYSDPWTETQKDCAPIQASPTSHTPSRH